MPRNFDDDGGWIRPGWDFCFKSTGWRVCLPKTILNKITMEAIEEVRSKTGMSADESRDKLIENEGNIEWVIRFYST